jgi:hypothetical protein
VLCCAAVALLCLSLQWARGFVGRLMADPAFTQKLVFEQLMAFSASMFYEWRVRGENFKKVGVGLLLVLLLGWLLGWGLQWLGCSA